MKIVVLTTGTNNTWPLYKPFAKLGHDVVTIVYDEMSPRDHAKHLVGRVAAASPDLIYYIGALEDHHGKPVPEVDVLAEVGSLAPMVHLCCDGAEPLWWPQLAKYYDKARFALQVNIDGVRTGPIGDRGFTTLCPIDAGEYPDVPWNRRPYWAGFSGGLHFGRIPLIPDLVKTGMLTLQQREDKPYGSFIDFMTKCKIALSVAYTGGGTGSMHCKARAATEGPAAGCLVLETEGSPLSDWFEPGEDFLFYDGVEGAIRQIKWAKINRERAHAMAQRMRLKVLQRHSPEVFLSQIMERLGMGTALYPAPEATFRYYEPNYHPPGPQPPRLVRSIGGINLVSFSGSIFIVPHSLGPIHLDQNDAVSHPAIRKFASLNDALVAIG